MSNINARLANLKNEKNRARYALRKGYETIKNNKIQINANTRARLQRGINGAMNTLKRIESEIQALKALKNFFRNTSAATKIQSAWRGYSARYNSRLKRSAKPQTPHS
jgi:hypothetical protein